MEKAIDHLALDKDSQSYVFKSSMLANIDRYFMGLKHNPKEERRFQRETVKHDKLKAQGKTVASVVPMNLVDCDRAHQNLINAITNLMEHFRQQIAAQNSENDAEQAVAMVDYFEGSRLRVCVSSVQGHGQASCHRADEGSGYPGAAQAL